MTIPEFNPRFTNSEDWSCASVDKQNPWCLAVSDCLWKYMERFYDIDTRVRYCDWPKDNKGLVRYYDGYDNQFYGLKNTDGTCYFAYQNPDYVFVICVKSDYYRKCKNPEGFGCVVGKCNGELHCVALGEDDGNYWGDHEIECTELTEYDWGYVSSVINDMTFTGKDIIVEKIFKLTKEL